MVCKRTYKQRKRLPSQTTNPMKIPRPLYLFDIDGTLLDFTHRAYKIQPPGAEIDWHELAMMSIDDAPIAQVITTALHLMNHADVHFFTARSDKIRDITENWIWENLGMPNPRIYMRPHLWGDLVDTECKSLMYETLVSPEDKRRLVAVFEDRSSVVEMWRSQNVVCYQVARGDY